MRCPMAAIGAVARVIDAESACPETNDCGHPLPAMSETKLDDIADIWHKSDIDFGQESDRDVPCFCVLPGQ
jgi:hypothetical protein